MESLTLDREVMHLKDELMPRYAKLVYNGYWWSPERRLLQQMIDAGLSRQVALATDLAETNQWTYIGGSPGPVSFLTLIRDRLLNTDVTADVIGMIMGGNISRRLAI